MVNILNYMLKFTTCSWLLLMLRMEMLNCQESPCPRVFRYQRDSSNNLFGIIEVPTPTNHHNEFLLKVDLSLGNDLKSEDYDHLIDFLGTSDDLEYRRPLRFRLDFPFWDSIPPKITSISLNEKLFCQGEPVHQTGYLDTSTLRLSFTLRTGIKNLNNFEDSNPTNKRNYNYYRQNLIKNNAFMYNPFNRRDDFFRNYPVNNNLYPFHSRIPDVHQYDYGQRHYEPPGITNTEVTNQPPFAHHGHQQKSNSRLNKSAQPVKKNKKNKKNNNFDSCGKPMSSIPLIANGNDVEKGAYPWVGALFVKKSPSKPDYLCGASLITTRLALTAGHCVFNRSSSDLYLVFGRINVNDWLDENDQTTSVAQAKLHPDYNSYTSDSDIAMLHFSKELTFTATVSPVCLWESDDNLKYIVNQTGVVVGWGQDEKYQYVDILQQLDVPVVSEETCLRSADDFFNVTTNRTFCAGKNDGTVSGPCRGDSGSGFYFNLEGRWTIRGIVSRSLLDSSRKCNLNQYTVYLDVAKYMEWIHTFLK